MTTRRGKIARLPLAIREEINRRLLENLTARKICGWLNELPEVKSVLATFNDGNPAGPIDGNNISEWRHGGFEDWSRRRDSIEETREIAQWSVKLAKASGGNITEGAAAILSGQILEVLEGLARLKSDSGGDDEKTAEKLAAIAQTVDQVSLALRRVRSGDHDRIKLDQNQERLGLSAQSLRLDREKFELIASGKMLDEAIRLKAEQIANSTLSHTDKIAAMRKAAFQDVDALDKTGEVQIPT
jgi:hypothetical protein